MDALMKSYLDMLAKLHEECKQALQGLSNDQLDWRPSEAENSIAVLAVHIAGAEKFWVGDCILEVSSNRDRPAEFATKDLGVETLEAALDESLDYVRAGLAKLSDQDLAGLRTHPRTGEPINVACALSHIIQHTALHLGHMQITRHWLKERSSYLG